MSEEIERPLTFIRDNAVKYAQAKADRVYLEQFRKSKKAMLFTLAEREGIKTVAEREAWAYSHPEYIQVLEGLQAAVEQEEKLRVLIDVAKLKINLYQTKQADSRAERKAYGA
ncbi:MAG: hypothetical protein IIZ69_13765 [Pseudomonas sp.]|jgi:phosphopantetheine adenylyltransferase|nr:hypothetical protein [Pseudomonas sp.]